MGDELIRSNSGDRALLCPLRIVKNGRGDILHALKASDETFTTFGEAYFSSVVPGVVKGWKKHTRMQMNLIVPFGNVCFHLHTEQPDAHQSVVIGEKNYKRLVVDPGIWVAFEAIGGDRNLILNLASIEHDSNEAINAPLSRFSVR